MPYQTVDFDALESGDVIRATRTLVIEGTVDRKDATYGEVGIVQADGFVRWVSVKPAEGVTVVIERKAPTNAEVWESFPVGTVFKFSHFTTSRVKRIKIGDARYAIEGDWGTYMFNDIDRPELWED